MIDFRTACAPCQTRRSAGAGENVFTMSTTLDRLHEDLITARTWVLVNGSSADAAVAAARVRGSDDADPPSSEVESATADFRCFMRDAITERRLTELRRSVS